MICISIFYDSALHSIDNALINIEKVVSNQLLSDLHLELYDSISNAVQKICDFYTRLDYSTINSDTDELFRAFYYLNNQIKHDKKLNYIFFNVYGKSYPYGYPYRYGLPGLFWANFPNNGRKDSRGKRFHYEKFLMNKEIKQTLIEVKNIILISI